MTDGLDFAGVNALVIDLTQAAASTAPKVVAAVHKTASDIEGTSKNFAPVDTGNLRNSIGIDYGGEEFRFAEANIGPTADYGAFVEFGTSTHAPQAYMGPALDRHGYQLDAALATIGGGLL